MKVAVLGSGNGGCAIAVDFALKGHEVSLFDFEKFPKNIKDIKEKGGIEASGDLEGFAKLRYVGHDLKETVEDAKYIFVVGPAFSTEPFAKAVKEHLVDGQIVVVCPGSCGGSLLFKKALGKELEDESTIVCETSTLPYACRITGEGEVTVYLKLKGGLFVSSLPAGKADGIVKELEEVFPEFSPAKNVVQVMLQNANPVIHPAVTMLNAALIERTGGDFFFYEDGVMPCVGRLMEKVDQERIEIGRKLGVEIIPDPVLGKMQGYMQDTTYEKGYSSAEGFKGIKAQGQLDHRYLNEDVGYGLCFMSELGKKVGVETPTMDSIINITSIIMKKDYRGMKNRTVESLGMNL